METPLVSVVMPAFNASRTLSESINSVLNQKYTNWELIVIDDGSIDNTPAIVDDFRKSDSRIILLKLLKNGGLPNARNEGCKIAKGIFIAFLDSDDLWHEDKLRLQIQFHSENPEIEISHTDFHLFNEKKIFLRPHKYLLDSKKDKQGLIYPNVCYKNPIGVLTVMAEKKLLEDVNFFDASLWTMEDQDLWVRIARKKKKFGYISKALAYYRASPGGITSKLGKYKRAYKRFINKLTSSDNLNSNLVWRYYYRHFGTVYFKKGKFKLSRLYFWKSMMLFPYDFVAFSTCLYLLRGLLKEGFSGSGLTKN